MSALWLVKCDVNDWDEYDAHVVRADTEERAIEMAEFSAFQRAAGTVTATQIPTDGPEEAILGSLNAG